MNNVNTTTREYNLFENDVTTKKRVIPNLTEKPLFPFWAEDRGLSFFLVFLVLVTIFVPMVHLSQYGRIGLCLMFALMLFSGAVASIRNRILMYLIIALTILQLTA